MLRAWYVLGVHWLAPSSTTCEGWFRTTLNWYQYSTAQGLHSLAAEAMSCALWPQVLEQGLLHLHCQPEVPPGHDAMTAPPS